MYMVYASDILDKSAPYYAFLPIVGQLIQITITNYSGIVHNIICQISLKQPIKEGKPTPVPVFFFFLHSYLGSANR